MTNDKDIIRNRFKSSLSGIVNNSNGLRKLLWTRYNFISLALSVILTIAYHLSTEIGDDSLQIITNLSTTGLSLLGGIVGLSLAGLTMIITFSNPEIVDDSVIKQYEMFLKEHKLNASYFQAAIAKFSFIVFVQVVSLLFFVVASIISGLKIEVEVQWAYWINSFVFLFGVYLISYSILLVIASVLNLFTFSQTSNFIKFISKFPTKKSSEEEE